jgi:hypothetical protein
MALGDSNLREQIAGLACLATPFILAWDRNIGRDPRTIVTVNSLVLLALAIFPLSLYFNLYFFGQWKLWILVGLLPIASALLDYVFVLLGKRVRAHASKLRDELTPRPLGKNKLLLIRSPADEASVTLAAIQFLSQVSVRLFLLAERLYVNTENLGKQPKKLLWIFISAFAVFLTIGPFLYWVFGEPWARHVTSLWLLIPLVLAGVFSLPIAFAALFTLFDNWRRLIFSRIFRRPYSTATFEAFLPSLVLAALTWLMIPLVAILMLPFGWQAVLSGMSALPPKVARAHYQTTYILPQPLAPSPDHCSGDMLA